jgi:hypothetical protein
MASAGSHIDTLACQTPAHARCPPAPMLQHVAHEGGGGDATQLLAGGPQAKDCAPGAFVQASSQQGHHGREYGTLGQAVGAP